MSNSNKRPLWPIFLIFFIVSNVFVAWYISQEKYLYFWDYVGYWLKFIYMSSHFPKDPLGTFNTLTASIRRDDYNYLPVFLLMPGGLLFGTGRLCYILSIVNIFAFPAAVLSVLLHKRFSQIYGLDTVELPFISAGLILFLPHFWQPTVMGLPDVGGVVLINVILLIYFSRPFSQQSMGNLVIMALLIAGLVLFRRWYAYWAVSFYIVLFLVECWPLCVNRLSRMIMQWAISAIVMFAVASDLVGRIIRTDYADIYSAFGNNRTFFQAFRGLVGSFGLFYFLLFLLGAAVAVANKKTRKFTIFLLLQYLIIFVLFTKTQDFGPQHFYLLIPTMLLFSSLFLAGLFSKMTRFKLLTAGGLILMCILNFLALFYLNQFPRASMLQKIFTNVEYDPRVREDIDEIDRMLSVLEKSAASPDDRVYVLSASEIMNCHILNYAYLTLNRHEEIGRKILWTHDVDKRDGFPQQFLGAQYVVVADPVQADLNPKDQLVLSIPAELILKGKGIGAAFGKLPYEFHLHDDVKAYIYKKLRPFKDSEIDALSQTFKNYYPNRENIYKIEKNTVGEAEKLPNI